QTEAAKTATESKAAETATDQSATELEAAQGLRAANVQAEAGGGPEDTELILNLTLIECVGNRDHEVSHGIDADDFFGDGPGTRGELDVVAAYQVRAVDLSSEQPQDRAHA